MIARNFETIEVSTWLEPPDRLAGTPQQRERRASGRGLVRRPSAPSASMALVAIVTIALMLAVGMGTAWAASPGHHLWARIYTGPANGSDEPRAIAVNPDSSTVFVTGNSLGKLTGQDAVTVAYRSDGSKLWVARYDGPSHYDDGAVDIGVSPDGTAVFITGQAGGPFSSQILVIAYDAQSGARTWSTRIGTQLLFDEAHALTVSPDGSVVFVTGVRRYFDDSDIRTMAVDASTGSVLWSRRYEGTFHHRSAPTDLRVSPDGSLLAVVGWMETGSGGLSTTDSVAVAYDAATGSRRWVNRFDGDIHGEDRGFGAEFAPDGSAVYVAAASESLTNDLDYLTFAYDAVTGSELWRHRYDGPHSGADQPSAIGVSPDGASVFVTGRSLRFSSGSVDVYDYATLAIGTASGDRSWVKRYDEGIGGSDEPVDLGVSPDGSKVFVTGTSEGLIDGISSATDFATLAYDAVTGARLGLQRYDGPCGFLDRATGLALSPDGSRAYVTGRTDCPDLSTSGDFATVAYPT
jgi:DNA-binding beta-propeller fold protein YncE